MCCWQAFVVMTTSSYTCSMRSKFTCNALLFSACTKFYLLSDISPTYTGTITSIPYTGQKGVSWVGNPGVNQCAHKISRSSSAHLSNGIVQPFLQFHQNYLVVCLRVFYERHSCLMSRLAINSFIFQSGNCKQLSVTTTHGVPKRVMIFFQMNFCKFFTLIVVRGSTFTHLVK